MTTKPCPLCGQPATLTMSWFGTPMAACGTSGCALSVEPLLADDWNDRPLEAAMTARAEAAEQRAEAAEARAAQAEAAGYRRAIDEACAALDRRYDVLTHRLVEGDHYGAGRLRGLDLAEEIVRALAPVEPVSKADELPGGAA